MHVVRSASGVSPEGHATHPPPEVSTTSLNAHSDAHGLVPPAGPLNPSGHFVHAELPALGENVLTGHIVHPRAFVAPSTVP